MQKLNQSVNDKNTNLEIPIIFLFSFLPISIIVGNAAININILLIDTIFLYYCFKFKFWSWLKNQFFVILIIIYIFLICNSIYSYLFIIEHHADGIRRSFLFVKYILLVFAFSTLLRKDNLLNKIQTNWLIISLIVILDILYEKYVGKNIFGYVSPNGDRIISFFKDEMVVGGYILCFGFTSVTFFLNKNLNKRKLIFYLFILFLLPIVIFLTGERSNFIKSLLLFLSLTFLFKNKRFLIDYKYLLPLFIVIISCFFYFSENTKSRYYQIYNRIIIAEKNSTIMEQFENIRYFAHYDVAIKILKEHPITGVGNKNFRKECSKNIYYDKNIKFSEQRCSTHPHQIHFEILSEQGYVGYLLIIYLFIIFLFKNYKIFFKNKGIYYLSNITYVLLFFLPLLPGGGVMSTFNGTLFWIIFSISNLEYEKLNLK